MDLIKKIMKKLLFGFAFLLMASSTFANTNIDRKDDVNKVSYTAVKRFEKDFKFAKDVSWKISDQYVKATFTEDGKKMAALYDLHGSFLGSVEYLSYEQIPVKARTEMEKRFKGYAVSTALKIVSRPENEDFNDEGSYWVDLSNEVKQIYVNISPSLSIAVHKTILIETAGN